MSTQRKRSVLSYIPGYTNNAVLQLIMASGVAFVILGLSWAIIKIVYSGDETPFNQFFIANVAMPSLDGFKAHWWTIFSYGWFHFNGFFELLSNMLWLYCFGSVVQMLVGHKQVIPLFIYSIVTGGIAYMLAQLLPGAWGKIPMITGLLGARALMAMAAAAVSLTPKYRFYLTETFSIPLVVVAGAFAVLMIIGSGFYLPIILLLVVGAATGFCYIKILQAGYRPGAWMYSLVNKVESLATPAQDAAWQKHSRRRNDILNKIYEPKQGVSQKRIDDILDKINQKGYNSLSAEEKEALMKVGKED